MFDLSAETTKEILGPEAQQSVDGGGLAGLGIKYTALEGSTSDGSSVKTSLELDKTSVKNAEEKCGVSRSHNSTAQKAVSKAANLESKGDELYTSSFSEKLKSKVDFSSSGMPPGARRDHRARSADFLSKNPFERRMLLKVRRTLDEVANRSKKTVSMDANKMPVSVVEKIVDKAIDVGANTTPIGPLVKAMKLVGYKPKQKEEDPWEKWAKVDALFPGSYRSTPKPNGS